MPSVLAPTPASAPISASAPAPSPAFPPALMASMATHPIRYPTFLMQSPVTDLASVAPILAHMASPALPTPTPSEYNVLSASNQSHVAKVIKISDPDQVYMDKAKDNISYEDWHLQMLSKISINASAMPSEEAKWEYVQSCVGGHAMA